jgi:hypothetical protein
MKGHTNGKLKGNDSLSATCLRLQNLRPNNWVGYSYLEIEALAIAFLTPSLFPIDWRSAFGETHSPFKPFGDFSKSIHRIRPSDARHQTFI